MILAKIKTNKGESYLIAEDESSIRSTAIDYFKRRYFTETVQINDIEILADVNKFYSSNTLIVQS
jgi:hypothetical protein